MILDFKLPIVKNISGTIFGDDLIPVQAKTIEEDVAEGRPIKEFPMKYDDFKSIAHLIEYIKFELRHNDKLKKEWLDVYPVCILPLNLDKDVYYLDIEVIYISCSDPAEKGCIRKNLNILAQLNPDKWNINKIKILINTEIKQL